MFLVFMVCMHDNPSTVPICHTSGNNGILSSFCISC